MSRLRNIPGWALAAAGALLLVWGVTGCEEDGKTAPEKCAEPSWAPYDIQKGPAAGEANNPCFTPVGHAYSSVNAGGTTASGTNDLAGAGAGGS